MSRLARNPVKVPSGVTVEVSGQNVKAKGPKGELTLVVPAEISAQLQDAEGGNAKRQLEQRQPRHHPAIAHYRERKFDQPQGLHVGEHHAADSGAEHADDAGGVSRELVRLYRSEAVLKDGLYHAPIYGGFVP